MPVRQCDITSEIGQVKLSALISAGNKLLRFDNNELLVNFIWRKYQADSIYSILTISYILDS